jgi:hypothetical protein
VANAGSMIKGRRAGQLCERAGNAEACRQMLIHRSRAATYRCGDQGRASGARESGEAVLARRWWPGWRRRVAPWACCANSAVRSAQHNTGGKAGQQTL